MAKQWKSLWDDSDDEGNGPDGAKQPRGPRPNPHYRGNDNAADDELASDEYGGFGWSGKFSGGYSGGSYRYDDAFDDSDDYWYRKNSFRYGKHADYSPSSLFRSAFSRSYSYSDGADNEATNKAIRALRNLSRSANTIVDKSAGSNQFAVQFSSGADSNGALDKLNDDKQRVVFVSPDELLDTKTTEDEDSVVDALTGFVLLRVQMAQDVALDVIERINNTGAHLAGARIAAQFVKPGAKPLVERTADELHGLSAAAVDDHLAGMLAKSVLMRLARRKVVSNWGGFAPYFIRHAKKFAAVKEHLEAAPLSVESVVSKLGYNMLADEEPIVIDKVFEEIAAKHLGEEPPLPQLLPVCRKLVAAIRNALTTVEESVPGEMEEALNAMLDKAQAAQKSNKSGGPLKDFLEKFGNSMLDTVDATNKMRNEHVADDAKENALADKLRSTVSAEQLLKKLTDAIAKMDEMVAAAKSENPSLAAEAQMRMMNVRNNVNYLLQSRPQALSALNAGGLKPDTDEIMSACQVAKTTVTEAEAKALHEKVEQFLKKASLYAKTRRAEVKAEATTALDAIKARMEKASALAEKLQKALAETKEELEKKVGVDAATKDSVNNVIHNLNNIMQQIVDNVARHKPTVEKEIATAATARSANTLEKAVKNARQLTHAALHNLGHVSISGYNWYALTEMIKQMLRTMDGLRSTMPNAAVVEAAVEEAISKKTISPNGFAAAMAKGAAGAAFDKWLNDESGDEDADEDEEEEEEEDADDEDNDDVDLSLDKATKYKLKKALEHLSLSGLNASAAEDLGKKAAEKLREIQDASSPVDGQLFGDAVEAKTKILDGSAIGRVNDEARNDPEEEYIAYLDNTNATKPRVEVRKEGHSSYRSSRAHVVKEVRTQHRGSIARVKNALQFQSGKRTAENFGLRSGDLDEGSLHKLGYDCDHIWSQKTISKLPDVAVGILVDQSGSMSGAKITSARTMCIILAEALKQIAGVRLYVYGHTANNGGADLTIYEHYTPTSSDLTNLGGIQAHSNNYDGYAVKDVAKRLAIDPAKNKYLFVIADGLPSGHGYGGETAEKHVTSVCKFIRDRLKIGVNAFAVGVSNHQQSAFKRQYGDDHVVFINDIMKCLPQIARFLRNTLQKERRLVGTEG